MNRNMLNLNVIHLMLCDFSLSCRLFSELKLSSSVLFISYVNSGVEASTIEVMKLDGIF